MIKDIALIGSGGHCTACIDVIGQTAEYRIAAITAAANDVGGTVAGHPITHTDDQIPNLVDDGLTFLVAVGQIRTAATRKRLFQLVASAGGRCATIVSPWAYVAGDTTIGAGTIVMHHGLVNAGARIGQNCILNSKSLVEHECTVGDHCHLSTGSLINGGVRIGDGTFVGSGAIIHQDVRIGNRCVIGAGAIVRRDVDDDCTVRPNR
ncbi:Putative acetyltransferase EpsM [Rubripirellula lacrimiformis]|uniref:Acetyltransferase EpsM n=1 Tax=Rubripirellula lacrimiformis TaxID=1930273 RepID=A0A517N8P1_9BACT|nr:acetyltransferase [Rubripirellula lacrimiformis]QDT03505.1 Putative acetyltransferase EpsM [Rubripirellula lacrimiformis]